jgi:hypothetical protein
VIFFHPDYHIQRGFSWNPFSPARFFYVHGRHVFCSVRERSAGGGTFLHGDWYCLFFSGFSPVFLPEAFLTRAPARFFSGCCVTEEKMIGLFI